MAVVNEYKMYGVTSTSAEGPIKFFGTTLVSGVATQNPLVNQTYIVKSLHVTNKSGANTPTITITNNGFQVINTQTLVAATSVEILTNPMVVEGNTGVVIHWSPENRAISLTKNPKFLAEAVTI